MISNLFILDQAYWIKNLLVSKFFYSNIFKLPFPSLLRYQVFIKNFNFMFWTYVSIFFNFGTKIMFLKKKNRKFNTNLKRTSKINLNNLIGFYAIFKKKNILLLNLFKFLWMCTLQNPDLSYVLKSSWVENSFILENGFSEYYYFNNIVFWEVLDKLTYYLRIRYILTFNNQKYFSFQQYQFLTIIWLLSQPIFNEKSRGLL